MVHPPVSRVRVREFGDAEGAGSPGARARSIARAVCDGSFVAAASVIKADNRASVFTGDAAGYPVVVKTLALDRLRDRIGSRIGATRLWRQARGAEKVRASGVLSASVYAIVRGRDATGQRVEALIIERVHGPTLLRAIADRTIEPRSMNLLLDRVGQGVGALAAAGIYNRDHKPSNLIVSQDESGEPVPVLIDTADIRRRTTEGFMDRMLAKLMIEAIGTGVEVTVREQVRMARAAHRESSETRTLRELVDSVLGIIESHGDPRPKDNPLAFDE